MKMQRIENHFAVAAVEEAMRCVRLYRFGCQRKRMGRLSERPLEQRLAYHMVNYICTLDRVPSHVNVSFLLLEYRWWILFESATATTAIAAENCCYCRRLAPSRHRRRYSQ
jgi:hypothetical protein